MSDRPRCPSCEQSVDPVVGLTVCPLCDAAFESVAVVSYRAIPLTRMPEDRHGACRGHAGLRETERRTMPRVKILPHELRGLGAEAEATIRRELATPLRKPRAKRGTGKVGKSKLAKAAIAGLTEFRDAMTHRKAAKATRSSVLEDEFASLITLAGIAAVGRFGMAVEREHRFHPTRKWRFDFAWLAARVAVELDGGNCGIGKVCPVCHRRQMGRHNTRDGFEGDCEKLNAAAALGWLVFRFTAAMLRKPGALVELVETVKRRSNLDSRIEEILERKLPT